MVLKINNKVFYKTGEACKKAGISRATFFRWVSLNIIEDVANKDRRGWRLFTEEDVARLRREAQKIHVSPVQQPLRFNRGKKKLE